MWCTGIDAHNMGCLASCEFVQALSGLSIPQLHVAIVTGRDELRSIGVEIDVVDRLGMARVGPQQLSLVVCVPDGNLRVCRS